VHIITSAKAKKNTKKSLGKKVASCMQKMPVKKRFIVILHFKVVSLYCIVRCVHCRTVCFFSYQTKTFQGFQGFGVPQNSSTPMVNNTASMFTGFKGFGNQSEKKGSEDHIAVSSSVHI
jgi:hypothetical protein